jgi:hypothetical protein
MKSKEELYAEIEKLKEVNLVDFVCHLYGYFPDEQRIKKENGNTTNPKYVFLENENGDRLLISRIFKDGKQQFVYKNLFNDLDHGNIFSFLKLRTENYSIPNAKKIIYDFQSKINSQYKSFGFSVELNADDIKSNTESKIRSVQQQYQLLPPFTNQDYLISRGLNSELLNSYLCKNRIKNENIYYPKISSSTKQAVKHVNTVFPIYATDGDKTFLCGYVKKNKNLKMTAEDSMYSLGIWASNYKTDKPITKLLICENPIDALSYCQLHIDLTVENPMLTATNGEITKTQIALYNEIILRLSPEKIVLGNDKNCKGQLFNAKLLAAIIENKGILKGQGYNLEIVIGYKNKHNAELIYKFSHNEGINNNSGKDLLMHIPEFVKINNFFQKKNEDLFYINDEHYPFQIEKSFYDCSSEISISFHNSTANWIEINKGMIEISRFEHMVIQLEIPNAIDWNEDLLAKTQPPIAKENSKKLNNLE